MESFKKFLRYFLITVISLLVFILLLLYPLIFSLYSTVIDQQNIITILRDSQAYSTIPPYLVDKVIEGQKANQHCNNRNDCNDTNIDPKALKKILEEKNIQDQLQKITEDAINQVYSQVKEKKSNIQIQVNVLEIKTLALTALIQIDSHSGNKNYSITELIKCTVISRINPNTGCTQDIVKMNKDFDKQLQQIDRNYKPGDKNINLININQPLIPILFTNMMILPFLLIFITLLLIAINILLFKDKTHGLFEIGIDILTAGVFNLLFWAIFHNNVETVLKSMNFEVALLPLAQNTINLLFSKQLFFTNVLLIIPAIIIIATAALITVITKSRHAKKIT